MKEQQIGSDGIKIGSGDWFAGFSLYGQVVVTEKITSAKQWMTRGEAEAILPIVGDKVESASVGGVPVWAWNI